MMHRAHSLALGAEETHITSLLREMLAPYSDHSDIQRSGPEIVLAQEAASAMAMVIDESGTHAANMARFPSQVVR